MPTDVTITETPVKTENPSHEAKLDVKSEDKVILSERDRIYAKADEMNNQTGDTLLEVDDNGNPLPVDEDIPLEVPAVVPEEEDEPEVPVELDTPAPEKMVKLKVYGRTIEVSEEKVEANGGKVAYQKLLAANEKAGIERDKADNLAEKERIQAERLEFERIRALPLDKPKKKTDLPLDDLAEKDIDAALDKAGESLIDGDVGAFRESIRDIVTSQKGEKVDVEAIIKRVKDQTIQDMTQQRQNDELRVARDSFSNEYPEIMTDADLRAKTNRRTILLQEEHPEKSPLEIMRLAGDEVIKLYTETPVVKDTVKEQARLDKLAEKRGMQIPKGGSARSQAPPVPKEPTRSDYVESLKKQRGQG